MAEAPAAPEKDALQDPKGFLDALVDPSFSDLITPKVIKVLYILSMIVIGISALLFVISAFSADSAFGLLALFVLAPLFSLIYLIFTRVMLEFIVVVFLIKDTNQQIVRNTSK